MQVIHTALIVTIGGFLFLLYRVLVQCTGWRDSHIINRLERAEISNTYHHPNVTRWRVVTSAAPSLRGISCRWSCPRLRFTARWPLPLCAAPGR
ncbi:hypothetical protein KCP69_06230 [Salmonella enterica subsp. enterica]|nr:hypothetical protein KCP69_06230 [Salmonella enterica subsp. enterica]